MPPPQYKIDFPIIFSKRCTHLSWLQHINWHEYVFLHWSVSMWEQRLTSLWSSCLPRSLLPDTEEVLNKYLLNQWFLTVTETWKAFQRSPVSYLPEWEGIVLMSFWEVEVQVPTYTSPLLFTNSWPKSLDTLMVNCMCQPAWAKGCSDTWLNVISGCVCKGASRTD